MAVPAAMVLESLTKLTNLTEPLCPRGCVNIVSFVRISGPPGEPMGRTEPAGGKTCEGSQGPRVSTGRRLDMIT